MNTLSRRLAFISLLVFALTACSGGGSSVAGGGVSGTGISAGAITDFGSIFVNGVEFDTTGATITKDGNVVSESDLRKGMVVTVRGSISGTSGTVTSVAAEDVVKGPVQSVAADGLSMVVLGQTVLVDNTTIIDNSIGSSITALTPGDLVEIHGFVRPVGATPPGEISASFIEKKQSLVEFRVKGFVQETDTAAKTFTIGGLTIDYSAADVGDLPGGNPVNDQLVDVKGAIPLAAGGELLATKVEPEGLGVADADQAEIEGFITSLTSTSEFIVGGQPVLATDATFAGCLQSEITVGLKVEVEGSLSNGMLTATKVSCRDSVKLESDVATVTGAVPNLSLTLKGLPAITITTNSQTELKNGVPASSNHVRIRARVASGNIVIASEVEVRSPDPDVVLQGPVDASPVPADPTFSVLGVLIDTTGIPDGNFEDVGDAPITGGRAVFFSAIVSTPARLVKAQGTLAGNAVSWGEMGLED